MKSAEIATSGLPVYGTYAQQVWLPISKKSNRGDSNQSVRPRVKEIRGDDIMGGASGSNNAVGSGGGGTASGGASGSGGVGNASDDGSSKGGVSGSSGDSVGSRYESSWGSGGSSGLGDEELGGASGSGGMGGSGGGASSSGGASGSNLSDDSIDSEALSPHAGTASEESETHNEKAG